MKKASANIGKPGGGGIVPHGGQTPTAKKGASRVGGKPHRPVPGPKNSTC